MLRRLAIVPARGGSKRISGKNIRDFCGKPIIEYPLNILKDSRLFDEIHVSTESEEILNVCNKIGFSPLFQRPKNLADDHTGLMDVMRYVVGTYADKFHQLFDQVWLVMPCSPFLEKKYIFEADKMAKQYRCDCIVSVTEYQSPIEWSYKLLDNDLLEECYPSNIKKRSQDLEKKYHHNGMLAVFSSQHFNIVQGAAKISYRGLVMSKDASVDIDDEDDWRLAELMYKVKNS